MIDTITIAEHLQEAGMEERVAKAVAKEVAVNHGEVATKEDLVTLKRELKRELKEGMVVLKEYVDQRFTSADEKADIRFAAIDQRFVGVDRRFVGVDQRLDNIHAEMIRGFKSMRWFIGILSGAIGIVVSVIMIVF